MDISGSSSDHLSITGTATLNGTLELGLVGPLSLLGADFDLIDWGSRSGTFASVDTTDLPSGTWEHYYGDVIPNHFTLHRV